MEKNDFPFMFGNITGFQLLIMALFRHTKCMCGCCPFNKTRGQITFQPAILSIHSIQ